MKEASANILLLAVDDDDAALDLLKDVLEENGVTRYILNETKEEFYQHKNSDINLILIDHRLDGIDAGLEIIKEVKQWNEENYIIIVSGLRDFDVAIEYLNQGANKFIYKHWANYSEKLVDALREGFRSAAKRLERARKLKEFEEERQKKRKEIDDLMNQIKQ